ncbi:hypothetical protein HY449_04255 [Candidatus Pacearchaeota archaeon]|nr:hypothetical protein [Candidatus Pacearchaeota archaeon]
MDEEEIKFILAFLLITMIFIGGVIEARKIITANAIKEQKEKEDYYNRLVDDCKCLEKNRAACSEGFVLSADGKMCKNEQKKVFTNILFSCSKYDCDGEINVYNNKTNGWEIENKQNE